MNKEKYCMSCGTNGIKDLSKDCFKCGYAANAGYHPNYCYNCGSNTDGYLICQNCNTKLKSKKHYIILVLLACFPLAPFYKFYAGRNIEGVIHLVLFFVGIYFISADVSIVITLICFLVLIIWYLIDAAKIFLGFPRDYSDNNGLHIR